MPAEKGKFGSLIADEQVRFEEEGIFSEGLTLAEPVKLPDAKGMEFLTENLLKKVG